MFLYWISAPCTLSISMWPTTLRPVQGQKSESNTILWHFRRRHCLSNYSIINKPTHGSTGQACQASKTAAPLSHTCIWVLPAHRSRRVSASCAVDAVDGRGSGDVGFTGLGCRAGGHVPGSGDDHDLWGQGLTPEIFWRHCAELQLVEAMPRHRVPSQAGAGGGAWSSTPAPRDEARVPRPAGTIAEAAFVIVDESDAPPDDNDPTPTRSNGAALGSGEREDSRHPKCPKHVSLQEGVVSPARSHLVRKHTPSLGRVICVAGGDAGVGVVFVLLRLFFNDDGKPRGAQGDTTVSKNPIIASQLVSHRRTLHAPY
ncbi:hypothetical protein V8E53_011378 [Lactarius tabidus]